MLQDTISVENRINLFLDRKTKEYPDIQNLARTIFRT